MTNIINHDAEIARLYAEWVASVDFVDNSDLDGDAPELQAASDRHSVIAEDLAALTPSTLEGVAILAKAALEVGPAYGLLNDDRKDPVSRMLAHIVHAAMTMSTRAGVKTAA